MKLFSALSLAFLTLSLIFCLGIPSSSILLDKYDLRISTSVSSFESICKALSLNFQDRSSRTPQRSSVQGIFSIRLLITWFYSATASHQCMDTF